LTVSGHVVNVHKSVQFVPQYDATLPGLFVHSLDTLNLPVGDVEEVAMLMIITE